MLTFYELKNRFNGDTMIRQLIISLVSLLICLTVMGITLIAAPPSLAPLKKLGEDGRNLIEEYLQGERMKTVKRALGLK